MSTALAARRTPGAPTAARLESLTGLRFAAALVVFAYHVCNFGYFTGGTGRVVDRVFGNGDTGVSFFFVLSGFVLTVNARPGEAARRFWRRRLARVYPLHVTTALAAILLGSAWLSPPHHAGAGGTAANLLLVSSWWRNRTQVLNPVSWTLTCEAFFYAMFPLLVVLLRRVRSVGGLYLVLAAAIAATLLLPWLSLHGGVARDIRFVPAVRLPEFVAGMAAARLVSAGAWRGPGPLLSTIVLGVGYAFARDVLAPYEFAACTILGIVLVVASVASRDGAGRPTLFARPAVVRLGELSFAFYLVHILVMRTAQALPSAHPGAGLGLTLAVFAVALGMACALNEFVEGPARRLILRSRW